MACQKAVKPPQAVRYRNTHSGQVGIWHAQHRPAGRGVNTGQCTGEPTGDRHRGQEPGVQADPRHPGPPRGPGDHTLRGASHSANTTTSYWAFLGDTCYVSSDFQRIGEPEKGPGHCPLELTRFRHHAGSNHMEGFTGVPRSDGPGAQGSSGRTFEEQRPSHAVRVRAPLLPTTASPEALPSLPVTPASPGSLEHTNTPRAQAPAQAPRGAAARAGQAGD